MNLTSVPLFDVLRERMSWLSARQNVLSQNVANADTPGYSAVDLKPLDFQKVLQQSTEPAAFQGGLVLTDPHHIAATPSSSSGFQSTAAGDDSIDQTGNSVSVEEEMMKVADTQAQYQAATDIYAKAISMMRTAIDKGT
ncbi:MAG TPA: flagellar basal body rod protein FlgB [Rhizomicrobium sp.]|nr:flagellar basal body rod protein FlgB [Rhizomicrobium sp.]